MKFQSYTFRDTVKHGKQFGATLKGGEVILLSGPLGCGKTAFTKGIAQGLGIGENVTSPSFTIMNEYEGEITLYHFDFYRIEDPAEMEELLEDYIYRKKGVSVIEWGEQMEDRMNDYIHIRFEIFDTYRVITIERRQV